MDAVIEIRNLRKVFPNFSLGPLDLSVPRGSIYGFIGANGAGKTTTIDLMMGMGAPSAGSISIFGLDHQKDEVEIKRRTGYFGVDTRYDAWGLVKHVVRFWRRWYPTWDDAYCGDLQRRFGLNDNDSIGTLSTGARTKLGLLLALSHRPELLLLDEPFSGLDAPSKRELQYDLMEVMKDPSRTVFLSSHNLSELERFADHLAILKAGRLVVEGATDAVLERFCMVSFEAMNNFSIAAIRGVYADYSDGNQQRVLVDRRDGALEQLAAHAAAPLQPVPVTLEDICAVLLRQEAPVS